jgi:hypothetical protein
MCENTYDKECARTHTQTQTEREREREREHEYTPIYIQFFACVHGPHITHTHQFTTQIFADQLIHVTAFHSRWVWGCGGLGVWECGGGVWGPKKIRPRLE